MRAEHWWFALPLRLKSIFRRRQADLELDEELQFHLDHKIEEGIARGLSPEEARYEALRALGGLEQHKEAVRDTRRTHALTDFLDDVRYAIRSLRRASGLTAFVVLTLGLGIGFTAAPFSMIDALIFRPYPVPEPGRVVTLVSTSRDDAYGSFSYREYLDLRDRAKSYAGVVAYNVMMPVGFSVRSGETPRVRGGMLVSGNFFRTLGVRPQLGRSFRDEEDRVPGRDAVVVLGRDCWKREFQGDRTVVGRTIRLNGRDFTVIGVAPESFPGLQIFTRPDFYVPLAMARTFASHPDKDFFEDRDDRQLTLRGRLARGVTAAEARSEAAVIARDLERAYPETNRHRGARVYTSFEMRTRPDDVNWKFGVIFSILAIGVLLVACTNVAGLLLSRASTRTREIAVRLALGAGRFRVIRLLLTESLILAMLGGLAGVVFGYVIIEFLQMFSIPATLPVTIPFRMDTRVLIMSVAASVTSALLCGLAPALQLTRTDLVTGLKAADVDAPRTGRLWGRNVLVVAQVAMSLMLLTSSFLMMRGFQNSLDEDTDFARVAQDHVLMASFDPRLMQYDAVRTRRFYEQLLERARQAPGVRSAALTRNPPLALDGFDALAFVPEGYELPPERAALVATMDAIDGSFFETMGIPLLRGRAFRASDDADAPRVAIVNEHFARHYWPGADAIGKRFRLGGPQGTPVEIVGIAKAVKYRDTVDRPTDFVYLPLAQSPQALMVLLLRSAGDPLQLLEPLEDVVRALDPNMPMVKTRSYREVYRYAAVEGPAVAINLVGMMGGMAVLLAMAGLYGLIAYGVSRRTREIGIRMALGAVPADVLRLVMGKGVALVAAGTAIGIVMGFGVERLMNAMVFNAGGVDFVVYALVVPGMMLVTLLAAYVPARRASRIEPTLALRYE